MSLESIIESLQKRSLTKEEATSIGEFKSHFNIDDEDPLVVVLALMARSQLILESMPNALEKKANETIELHRMALRDQSVLIAKELISVLAENLDKKNIKHSINWLLYAGLFVGGSMFTLMIKLLIKFVGV